MYRNNPRTHGATTPNRTGTTHAVGQARTVCKPERLTQMLSVVYEYLRPRFCFLCLGPHLLDALQPLPQLPQQPLLAQHSALQAGLPLTQHRQRCARDALLRRLLRQRALRALDALAQVAAHFRGDITTEVVWLLSFADYRVLTLQQWSYERVV